MYIADQESLAEFVRQVQDSPVLAVDTEFLREKTYYPKLCLLQLSTGKETALIDPFALKNLDALIPLFTKAEMVKIFHAGKQDLEIILHEMGFVPSPLFDTQVAAAVLGHTQQIGLASLIYAELGVQLPKTDSYTDWSHRPLSESQLHYAADDVVYLPKLYAKMYAHLLELDRLAWLEPEFQEMANPEHYRENERERYRRLKRGTSLSRRQMAAARELAAWRELEAQNRDVPRKWVLTDEQVVEVCKREPHSISDLYLVRGMREKLPVQEARRVLRLIRSALDSPPDSWPELDRSGKSERNVDSAIDLMTALVRLRAKENGIAMPTLASHDDLVRMARGYRDNVELLRGWRRSIVGEELLDLLDGKLALSLEDTQLRVARQGAKDGQCFTKRQDN